MRMPLPLLAVPGLVLVTSALVVEAPLMAAPLPAAERDRMSAASRRFIPRPVFPDPAGNNGAFDASVAGDGGERLWMSYASVATSPIFGAAFNHVSTRLAYSDDGGRSWQDAGLVVNPNQEVKLPPPNQDRPALWEHEVPALIYDPGAAEAGRWKLLWHRYLRIWDPGQETSVPLFDHGWIGLKTAPSPLGPWSAERKLFAGSLYQPSDDAVGGPPEQRLDQLFPGADGLGDCLAFTEPGLLARDEGIYVALKCSEGTVGGKIALLLCSHDLSSCSYRGALLDDTEARLFSRRWDGFSASELAARGDHLYLFVTPTEGPASIYRGCLVFEVEDLETAALRRTAGRPDLVERIGGGRRSFSGACGYAEAAGESGVIYNQYYPERPPQFRLFASGVHPGD